MSTNKHYLPPIKQRTSLNITTLRTLSLVFISIIITLLLYRNDFPTLYFNPSPYPSPNNSTLTPSRYQTSTSHDYNKYVWSKDILPHWDPASHNRLIAFGDIHGMLHPLKELLEKLNYDPSRDTVVLVGDLAAKHPNIQASLDTIRFCRESKLEAVRGNHDQYIITWRNWMEAHRDEFIEPNEILSYRSDHQATLESDAWLNHPEPPQKLKHKLPEGLKWKAQHFEIAKRLPKIDFLWMLERSLTIYVSSLRTYFVHAGMLPWDLPNESRFQGSSGKTPLLDVEENKNAYTLLEMRGLKKGRKPTKDGTKGHPWFKHWNKVMSFAHRASDSSLGNMEPHHVVYGHWAARGLTIKPWSLGLDSGCVFGRQLSALVIGEEDMNVKKHKNVKIIPIPINQKNGKVFQIPCQQP